MKTDKEFANELARGLPICSYEICDKHTDDEGMSEVHIHLFCDHGKVIGDFIVRDGGLFDPDLYGATFGPPQFLNSILKKCLEEK